MAAKRTLPVDLAVNDVDEESTEYEQGFEDLRNEVIAEVIPKHPICYDNSNLCELVKESKLSIFSISMLQKICEKFDVWKLIKYYRRAKNDEILIFGCGRQFSNLLLTSFDYYYFFIRLSKIYNNKTIWRL